MGLNVIISIQVFQHCWLLFSTLSTETRADPHISPFTPFSLPLCLFIYFTSLSEVKLSSWTPKQILERLARFVFTIPDRRRGREGGREGRNWLSLKVVVVMRRGVRWVLSGKYRDLIEWWRWRYSHVTTVSTTDLHVVITDLSRFISFNYVDLYNSIVLETF